MILLFVLYLYSCVFAYFSFSLNLHSGATYCISLCGNVNNGALYM